MNNDSYHFYTLMRGSDGNYLDPEIADNWVEFRIVNVGQLNEDGTGLTFQAVHMMPKAYKYRDSQAAGGFNSSNVGNAMSPGGEIFDAFDVRLSAVVSEVDKLQYKGSFWIPSYGELTNYNRNDYFNTKNFSEQFQYWRGKVLNVSDANDCLMISGTRSGSRPDSMTWFNDKSWWLRDTVYNRTTQVCVNELGNPFSFVSQTTDLGVVPCFSL